MIIVPEVGPIITNTSSEKSIICGPDHEPNKAQEKVVGLAQSLRFNLDTRS